MSFLAPPSPFEPPSLLYLLVSSPPKFLLRLLYRLVLSLRASPSIPSLHPIRVVCLSDTHSLKPRHIPDGHLLIHAGDLTNSGTLPEIQTQIDWIKALPHEHKVVIAGNHDTYLDPRSRSTLDPPDSAGSLDWGHVHYLQHSSINLTFPTAGKRSLRIYGAPQIPACGGPEFAFQYPRGTDAWTETIPKDTDVLVTHTPAKSHLDLPVGLGCEYLLNEIWRVQPRLHVFGHVHAARAQEIAYWDEAQDAYEDGCSRDDGFIKSTLNPYLWWDIAKVLWFGASNLIWQRIWGGEGRATRLVNASCMYINTGKLGNPPQTVEI